MLRRDQHQIGCNPEPDSLLVENTQSDNDTTTAPSIAPVIATKRKRKTRDVNKVTEGFPKQCPDGQICGVVKEFANVALFRNHQRFHPDKSWPKDVKCNVPDCQLTRDHTFISREALRRHLATYHLLDAAQARDYIGKIIPVAFMAPRGISKQYLMTMCLFPGCTNRTEYANYAGYTTHLKKKHSLTAKDYPNYMPTAATVRLHLRPGNIDATTNVDREFISGMRCAHQIAAC